MSRNEGFVFNTFELEQMGITNSQKYKEEKPFPHIVIDNFLCENEAELALYNYPKPDSKIWLDWKVRDVIHQPKKQGIGHASRLVDVPPRLVNLINSFNSYPFLNFLEKLTGIPKLLPDPYLNGGGLHQILSGGKLAVHTDFNQLNGLDLYRRINVLLYLNKNWQKSYNGDLELWDQDCTKCVKSVEPLFNRLVVFNTNKESFHGHPIPLNTPENITRKSIALYYYTAKAGDKDKYDELTDWQET